MTVKSFEAKNTANKCTIMRHFYLKIRRYSGKRNNPSRPIPLGEGTPSETPLLRALQLIAHPITFYFLNMDMSVIVTLTSMFTISIYRLQHRV